MRLREFSNEDKWLEAELYNKAGKQYWHHGVLKVLTISNTLLLSVLWTYILAATIWLIQQTSFVEYLHKRGTVLGA